MAERTAVLHYRTDGAERSTAQVISLAEAQARLRQRTAEMAPILRDHTAGMKLLDGVSSSATAKISSLTNTLGPLGAGLGTVSREAPRAAMGLLQYVAAAERANLLNRTLNVAVLGGASAMLVGAVAAASYADNAIRAGDSYATLKARIDTFTDSAAEAASVEEKLYDTAAEARTPVRELTTLWSRLAPAVKDYGKTQQDALTITALTSKALAIQGADIREQAAATIQFSQAIASGVMRGDELRSLLESSPQLLRYIAQNLEINGKVGVAFSQLRKLGEEGALSTDKIINALLRAQPQIEADFINAPKTAQQYWQVLSDQVTRAVGQISQASGAQQGVVNWLADLAKKADAFREKMIMDPRALDPVKEATRFVGDAVGTIEKLGGAAVEHFDDIVSAGQLIIALKLGEVFASWFATAAKGAQTALTNLQAFRAAARFEAGAALNPVAADAARSLRGSAVGLEVRAVEQAAIAEQKLAIAKAARATADRAAAEAAKISTLHGVASTMATDAQTRAEGLNALAKRAEDAANKAVTASENTKAAATLRATVATEAEATVTAQATTAQIAKNAVMRAATGLYGLLGGAVGIATLALGGLIYATWKAEEAHRAKVAAMIDAVDVTDRLDAITREMTSATWAQIPALQLQAQTLRENAAAALVEAEAQLKLAEARQRAIQAKPGGVLGGDAAEGGAYEAARRERDVDDRRRQVDAARNAKWKDDRIADQQHLQALSREALDISGQLQKGKDNAGRALSAADRSALTTRRAAIFSEGQAAVDRWQAEADRNKAALNAVPAAQRTEDLLAGQKRLDALVGDAAGVVSMADTAPTVKPPTPTTKAKKVSVPGPVNSALDELIRQDHLPKAGGDRFSVRDGKAFDSSTGAALVARSDDEAAAAAKYVEAIMAINTADDAQIKKTGETREALRDAASARLAHALETSKAARADERWAEIQAEMTGESRAVVKAQREINDLVADGTTISKEAAQAYIDFIRAREAGKRVADAMQFDAQHARDALDETMAGVIAPVDGRGIVDVEARTRQFEERREAILTESRNRIWDATFREIDARQLSEEEGNRLLADRIAANKVAVELVLQEQLQTIRKEGRQASAEADEAEARKLTDMFITLGEDLGGGSGKDAAVNFLKSLERELAKDLVWEPLRQVLLTQMRKLLDGQDMGDALMSGLKGLWSGTSGGGGGDFLANLGKSLFGSFGGSPGGHEIGHGGFSLGGWTGDGPRDEIAGAVHREEFVVKAGPARQHRGFLERLSAGLINPEAPSTFNGGFIGVHPQYMPDPMAGLAATLQAFAQVERQAASAGAGGGVIAFEFHDHSTQKHEAKVSQEGGVMKVDLYDAVGRGMMKQGAKDPQVRKAFGAPTPPVRRTR